jgi:hypothetical protein
MTQPIAISATPLTVTAPRTRKTRSLTIALADLAAGRVLDALDASGRAVDRLAATGTLPALRSEEVYLTRYKVLRAAGAAEAGGWLDRARQTLLAKAATLPTRKLRDQFLARHPRQPRHRGGRDRGGLATHSAAFPRTKRHR